MYPQTFCQVRSLGFWTLRPLTGISAHDWGSGHAPARLENVDECVTLHYTADLLEKLAAELDRLQTARGPAATGFPHSH